MLRRDKIHGYFSCQSIQRCVRN